MIVAYFADGNYPSHDIKWINYLSVELNVKAVVFLRPDSEFEHFDKGVTLYRNLKSLPLLNYFARQKLIRIYKQVLDEHKVDIIHFLGGELKCQYGPFLRRPFVITTRGTDILEELPRKYGNIYPELRKRYLSHLLGRHYHLLAYRNAICVTSTSHEQIEAVKKFQVKVRNQLLVRTGCFIEEFKKSDFRHSGEFLRIFSPRTMKKICNQDIILKAFALYLKKEPCAELKMVDNLPESLWSSHIRKLVKELEIERKVEFLPALNKIEMREQYELADVCVMIPNSDGTPVSGIECMLSGTPLIIGDYSYDSDLFNSDTVWQLGTINERVLLKELLHIALQFEYNDINPKLLLAQKKAAELADTRKEMSKIFHLYKSISSTSS